MGLSYKVATRYSHVYKNARDDWEYPFIHLANIYWLPYYQTLPGTVYMVMIRYRTFLHQALSWTAGEPAWAAAHATGLPSWPGQVRGVSPSAQRSRSPVQSCVPVSVGESSSKSHVSFLKLVQILECTHTTV